VLAFDLGNAPFQAWVDQELDGYSDDAVLPTYRIGVSAAVKANAMNVVYRATNVVVPISAFPEGIYESLSSIDFRQSVGELEEIVSSARARGDGSVRVNIDASVWGVVEFENDYNITDMWREISVALIAAILDAVRNTALRFALEMDRLDVAGDLPTEAGQATITNVFQTLVQGGTVSIAAHAEQVTQIGEINVQEGDLDSLLAKLREVGMGEEDLRQLADAIAEDSGTTSGPGTKVWSWLKRTAGKVPGTAGDVGLAATKAAVTAAVLKYFGMG
jgi:hypothetical protein